MSEHSASVLVSRREMIRNGLRDIKSVKSVTVRDQDDGSRYGSNDAALKAMTSPYAFQDPLNFLHILTLLLSISKQMRCQMCKNLLLDCTVLNCGHAFCKFCLTSWLRLCDQCPTCLRNEVHPVCNRCFQLDALNEAIYPLLLKILAVDPTNASLLRLELPINLQPDIKVLRRRMEINTELHILSATEKRKLRDARRQVMKRSNCIIESCPNRSMLQSVTDLGFGLRNSLIGFGLIFVGSIFLTIAACHVSEVLEKLGLISLRRLAYVILILYLLCSNSTTFIRNFGANGREQKAFWEQIITTTIVEELDRVFETEKAKIIRLVRRGKIRLPEMQNEATRIMSTLKQGFGDGRPNNEINA